MNKRDSLRLKRRKRRVRSGLQRTNGLARVSVFKSLRNMQAQIIDDSAHNTLASCSSLDLENVSGDKKAIAYAVGLELAKRAKEKGIAQVVFDRGACRYHGRVQALAEGLREGGITI